MAWQLWAVLTGLKLGQGHWKKQLDSVRSFQELFSTYNLGLFVGLNSETGTAQAKLLQELDTAIRAIIYLCPATFIYNLYWGEIYGTPWLRAYFEKFQSWRSFYAERIKDPTFFDYIDVTDDFLVAMADLIKQYITIKSHGDIIENPWVFSVILRGAFEDNKLVMGDTTIRAAKDFLAKVAHDEDDAKPVFIKDTVIRLCNPAMDLEWTVIKMAITQLYFYDVILRKNPGAFSGRDKPRPYVKGQRYKLYENGKELSWTPIVDEGIVSVTPDIDTHRAQIATDEQIAEWKTLFGEKNVKVYQLDSHGIKSEKIAALEGIIPVYECGPTFLTGSRWRYYCRKWFWFDDWRDLYATHNLCCYARFKLTQPGSTWIQMRTYSTFGYRQYDYTEGVCTIQGCGPMRHSVSVEMNFWAYYPNQLHIEEVRYWLQPKPSV